MNKTQTRPVWSAPSAKVRQLIRTPLWVILTLMVALTGLAFWQLDTRPLTPTASYQAPVLELFLMGAVPATLRFGNADEFAEVKVTSSELRFITAEDAPFAFRLEFQGAAGAGQQAFYDLRGGAYPLTLTLLEGGHAQTFTAFDGTVSVSEDGSKVAAFLLNKFGEQIFLSARF